MSEASVSLVFARPPSLGPSYLRAFLARRPMLVPAGATVPRIEARLTGVVAGAGPLGRYRRVCGFAEDDRLPLTYPHVLAMPVHLAMLASEAFPVRLLGLVHLKNQIVTRRGLRAEERLDMHCLLEGFRESERGQEFELHTEVTADGTRCWSEVSTFLARKRRTPSAGGKSPEVTVDVPVDARELRWTVPTDAGRRYARVSGDYNPIHLWSVTARPFGFDRPIVHGMWSLARVVAALGPGLGREALSVAVSFKRPVALPAQVTLKHWPAGNGTAFVLQDSEGRRPHLVGELSRGSPRPG